MIRENADLGRLAAARDLLIASDPESVQKAQEVLAEAVVAWQNAPPEPTVRAASRPIISDLRSLLESAKRFWDSRSSQPSSGVEYGCGGVILITSQSGQVLAEL